MNDLEKFVELEYDKAVALNKNFRRIKEKEWNSLTILLELSVQMGHVLCVMNKDNDCQELGRNFNNLGDELSDILLQLCNFINVENIEIKKIKRDNNYKNNNIESMQILISQLTEVLMEKYGYRFYKEHENFLNYNDFIEDRLIKLFSVIFNIADENNLELISDFEKMVKEANLFIEKKA